MSCSSDSTSLNDWIQFPSSDGTSFEYKTEGVFIANWITIIDGEYSMGIYLPALPMHHTIPFKRNLKIDQFKGHKFKVGRSKK